MPMLRSLAIARHSVHPCASRTLTMAPRTLFQVSCVLHHRVREHAAVPADVAHRLGQVAVLVAQPVAGVLDDIEAAVGVVDAAVAAGLLVVAGAEDGAVVLGDVEVEGPGAERVGDLAVGGVERRLVLPVEARGEDAVGLGVVAERVEHRVRHVGLVADDAGRADRLEQVAHRPPGVHAAPADLALGDDELAVVGGDVRRPREKVSAISFGVALRVLVPGLDRGRS